MNDMSYHVGPFIQLRRTTVASANLPDASCLSSVVKVAVMIAQFALNVFPGTMVAFHIFRGCHGKRYYDREHVHKRPSERRMRSSRVTRSPAAVH